MTVTDASHHTVKYLAASALQKLMAVPGTCAACLCLAVLSAVHAGAHLASVLKGYSSSSEGSSSTFQIAFAGFADAAAAQASLEGCVTEVLTR